MRDILFRGKRVDNGEWIFGDFAGGYLICENLEDTENATGRYYGQTPYVGFVEVIPETVGQYTGLTDKNGKRIFWGDVVVSTNERRLSNKACVVRFHPLSGYWMLGPEREPVVIGNIYDNPELMGGTDNG